MTKVVSLDIWNTLIKISKENAKFLTNTLFESSELKNINQIINITKLTGRYFDELAIHSGYEIKSIAKLEALIKNCRANLDPLDLSQLIEKDLCGTPPLVINPKSLEALDNYLASKEIGLIFSSNSGFVGANVMRTIMDNIGLTQLKSYESSFYSEELNCAKPSVKFFKEISKSYDVILHCGDNIVADNPPKKLNIKAVIFDQDAKNCANGITNSLECLKNVIVDA